MRCFKNKITIGAIFFFVLIISINAQTSSSQDTAKSASGYSVILDSKEVFKLFGNLGTFTAKKRADEISIKLDLFANDDKMEFDSIKVLELEGLPTLAYEDEIIMSITPSDALPFSKDPNALALEYRQILVDQLTHTREIYSHKSMIENGIYTAIYLVLLILFFWLSRKVFPWIHQRVIALEGTVIKTISFRGKQIIRSSSLIGFIRTIIKGIRLALSLFLLYLFFVEVFLLWPYTRAWEIEPVLKGVILFIFYTAILISVSKGLNALLGYLINKYQLWKGTIIKSVKIKSVELLSADRTVEILEFGTKILRFAFLIIIFYSYVTIVFSLFEFSRTWADKLLAYIMKPLNSVFTSIVNFLPNLFFIIVLVIVFHYLIRFVKFLFGEIERKNLVLPGFHEEWAMPTFKIVRFLILILAAIIIFPYLPGSDSPFFQGISVFVGILFSLGSTSAIANIVAGTVLTYMRPFKIGDRVKIADTVGDIVEKTLLVTRIRTIKNVDITIPNAMILSSHIINYSSSADQKGLILHTTVTIGYDVPWKQVHELLISAANETENIKQEPKPFVLQTSLDDFYVSYELNAYTDNPGIMAKIYSQLHSKIQDKFNEAGVEIMSPHYGAMRDGNQTTIPSDYLPKKYQAPSFRLFGVNLFGDKPKGGE